MGSTSELEIVIPQSLYKLPVTFLIASSMKLQDRYILIRPSTIHYYFKATLYIH